MPDDIWVSHNNPTEGDIVDIYVTVFNTSVDTLHGTVEYYDEEALLGEVSVVVAQNNAKLAIFSWEAVEGSRVFSAKFLQNDVIVGETSKVRITVAPRPVIKEESVEALVLPETISDFEVPAAAHSVVSVAENGRLAAARFFEEQQEKAKAKKELQQQEEMESSDSAEHPTIKKAAKNVGQSSLVAMLGALSFVGRSAVLFYGLIVLLIILFIRKMMNTRSGYDYE